MKKERALKIKYNSYARANLGKAMMEDQFLRLESQNNSHRYLKEKEDRDSTIPSWVWNLLWFALGVLFTISLEKSIVGLIHG